MIKKLLLSLLLHCCFWPTFAQTNDFQSVEDVLNTYQTNNSANCSAEVFSNALLEHSDKISESDSESAVYAWAKTVFESDDVLEKILQCPEITHISDTTTITFTPVAYTFPRGRTITINYSTQPKILKQKLLLSRKPSLPNGDVSPKLMDPNDPAKYLNTEPSWYGILVVQHDSLSEFVGPGKNNTLSLKYINDNIDRIYPHGYYCTSKSALANDKDTINQVVHEVVKIEKDTNDYYVAGDVNLEWVMYAEIAADILLTVATAGGGEAGLVALKGVRATRTAKNLRTTMKALTKSKDVIKYTEKAHTITRHSENIAKLNKYETALKNLERAKKSGKDIAKYEKEVKEISESIKGLDTTKLTDIEKIDDARNALQESIKTLEKETKELEKTSKDVKQYKEFAESYVEVVKYRRELRALRRPQTGNVITRTLKTIKASNTGAKNLTKAGKVARTGMSSRSAKIKDWLFDATLKHGARLARFERDAGLIYGALSFLGDMYDQTSSTSKEFSNGIEFKPLCLLSADDLEGQENVVNYGMWLMWVGNSTDSADDDAAYLQAMDFASKFYYQLDEFQDTNGANCNVDIYVVRPIIRLDETNITNPSGEMFYLFMNEIPWTTADQFGEQIKNIDDWERVQKTLDNEDPQNKHKQQTIEEPGQIPEYVAAQETIDYEPEILTE